MRNTMIAAALVFGSLASTASAQQSYNPGTQPAAAPAAPQQAAPTVDRKAEAQKRFASWQEDQRACLKAAGLVEGSHFRVSPKNPMTFQVNDLVWLNPKFDHAKIEACK